MATTDTDTFTVTATDKAGNTDTIDVTVTIAASTLATLRELIVTPADGPVLTLTPGFDAGVFAYTADAPAFTTFVTVDATATAISASVDISGTASNGTDALTFTNVVTTNTVSSAVSSAVSALTEGDNTITASVTPEDTTETPLTYTLTLTVPTSTLAAAGTATALTFTPQDSTPTTVYVTVPVPGNVVATPLPTPPSAPAGVEFALTVDIAFNNVAGLGAENLATVCLPTDPNRSGPSLYHNQSGEAGAEHWEFIGNDTTTQGDGYVCGTTTSFSPFTVGYTTPSETTDETTDKAAESARLTAISKILLPEVSRAMTDTTVSAITQRLDQAAMWNQQADDASPAGNYTIGGQSTLADVLRTGGQALADDTLNLRTMLGRSAFVMPLQAGDGWGNRLTLWGNGDYRAIGGDSGVSGGGMTWDGSLVSARVGVDAQVRDDLLAGAAVSWTDGDFDYGALTDDADDGGGNYALEMTTVHPYLNWNILPTGGLDLWATVGYGWGDVIIRDRVVETAQTSEATMTVLGGGLTSQLLQVAGATLRLKSEVMQTAMDLEGRDRIAALTVNARRVRVTLAGTHDLTLDDGSSLLTSLDFGMRHDGGDGRAGAGGEIGGGLEYRHPATRLTLASHSRVLLGHTGGYDDWGVGGMLSLQPGRDGQGLAISLAPAYGQTQTQTAQLWDQGAMGLTGTDAAALGQRMDAEVGYGLAAMGGSLLTPYSNMTWGGATREYRLGSRLTLPSGLTMSFEGVRGEPVGAVAAHRLQWQTGWRWLTASVQTSGAERRMSLKAEWRW